MTQKTKDTLKKVNDLLKIGLMTFAWLMACVGITAYSVYWLRQNANYEQETEKCLNEPRRLNNDNEYGYFSFHERSYYNSDSFSDKVYEVTQPLSSPYVLNLYTTGSFDFGVLNGDRIVGNYIYFELSYFVGNNVEGWVVNTARIMPFYSTFFGLDTGDTTSTDTWVYWLNSTFISNQPFYYTGSLYFADSSITIDPYDLMDLIFDVNYNSKFSTFYSLDFTNPYLNFEQLLSYSRIGVYDFIKVGSPFGSETEIPLTFIFNNVLYESIIIDDIYVVQYLNDDGQKVYYKDTSGDVTTYLMTCWAVYFKEYGGSYVRDPSVTTGYSPVPLVGDLLQVAYREVAYYEPSILGSGSTYNSYPVWNMAKGYNTYGRISYDLYVSNASLDDIPFPNNDVSSAHYPLQNLTNREILNYITTYNNDGFSNFGVGSDVGLGGTFTLLRGAFVGLIDLFSISIIPGITFGLLIFLPIIVGVIIVILRLVKK